MFIISSKLEQLQFKLEKIIGISKHAGKVRKSSLLKTYHHDFVSIENEFPFCISTLIVLHDPSVFSIASFGENIFGWGNIHLGTVGEGFLFKREFILGFLVVFALSRHGKFTPPFGHFHSLFPGFESKLVSVILKKKKKMKT